MNKLKRILTRIIIILSVVLIGLIIYVKFFLADYLQNRLEASLRETFGTYYSLEYDDIETSIGWSGLTIRFIQPKFVTDTSNHVMVQRHPVIFFDAASLNIEQIPIREVLFKNSISAHDLVLSDPNLVLLINNSRPPSSGSSKSPSSGIESIDLKHVQIVNGNARLSYLSSPKDTLCSGVKIAIDIDMMSYLPNKSNNNLILGNLYQSVELSMTDAYYVPQELPYSFGIDSVVISTTKQDVYCYGTHVIPDYHLNVMSKRSKHRETFANLFIRELKLIDYDLSSILLENTLRFRQIQANGTLINLSRNQDRELNRNKHIPLLHEYLLDLPFSVDIDSIRLTDTELAMDLQFTKRNQSAKVDLTNLDILVSNIYTDEDKKDTMFLSAQGELLGSGSLMFDVQFPMKNPNKHYYQCSLGSMSFKSWNPILGSFIGADLTSGHIHSAFMSGYCTHLENYGNITFLYHDLKLKLKNQAGRTKPLLSVFGNLLVQNSNPSKKGETPIISSYSFKRKPYQGTVLQWIGGPLVGMCNTMLGEKVSLFLSGKVFDDNSENHSIESKNND